MHWLALATLAAAIGWWIGSSARRRETRRRTDDAVKATLATGLPPPESAIGKIARVVAAGQAEKLVDPPPVHGTARWAMPFDVEAIADPAYLATLQRGNRKLWLGSMEDGPHDLPITVSYPGHLLTVAGTGQGKSATQIIANLMTYRGSAVVIDPKGELYATTAERRRRFGRVYRLAPLARKGEPPTDHYNPMEELEDPDAPWRELGSRARRLAEMLIVRQGDKGAAEAAFWENEAVNLLTAIIMYVVETERFYGRTPTLDAVRRICSLPVLGGRKQREDGVEEYVEDILRAMGTISRNEMVRRQGNAFRGRDTKQLGSFLSEINSNLAFWDGHPGFSEATSRCDFKFADLEKEPMTVYLTVPFKDMATSFRFLRAMIGMAFSALDEKPEAKEASVLFILDEFAALRDMDFMRDAVAQMRSSGAWFWFFVQDLAQLEGIYGKWAEVFLSQTDHQIFFGGTLDPKTKKHISTALGVTTFAYRDANINWSHSIGENHGGSEQPTQIGGVSYGRNVGQTVNITEPVVLAPRPLLTPFEVGTFLSERRPGESHPSTTIILSKQSGGYPIKARRTHWKSVPGLVPEITPIPALKIAAGDTA